MNRTWPRLLALLLGGAVASAAVASDADRVDAGTAAEPTAPRYTIDPVHSRVLFSVEHAGFSNALGTFAAPRGTLQFPSRGWRGAGVEVELDLATLDLGNDDWNARMQRHDFLASAEHPIARFRSERIEPIDDRHAVVHGLLTLRGRSRPVTLDVRLNRHAPHPLTMRRTVGFSAVATLSRSAFGMTAWPRVVGDTVELRIEVEAQRSRD